MSQEVTPPMAQEPEVKRSGPRLIDEKPAERKKPVRVLILGLSRTGNTSLCAALRKLGYTPYQMRNLLAAPETIPLWNEGMSLTLLPPDERHYKMRNTTIFPGYAKPEFDTLLGEYDAISDIPASLFWRQLVEAYPDAKIIVTARDYQDWEDSMQKSVWLLLKWKLFIVARTLGVTKIAPLTKFMHTVFRVHNRNHYGGPEARAAYEKYYADVREAIPANKRLEIECGKGKWEPLLEFLGKEDVHEEKLGPYPEMDENASMEQALRQPWWEVLNWFLNMGIMIVLMLFGVWVIWNLEWVVGQIENAIDWDKLWDMWEDALFKVFGPLLGFFEDPNANATAAASSGTGMGKDEL